MAEYITYMHVDNTTLSPNDPPVNTSTQLGTQSTQMGHVHFQAYDSSTYMPTGKDDTLECRIPYGFMTWHI